MDRKHVACALIILSCFFVLSGYKDLDWTFNKNEIILTTAFENWQEYYVFSVLFLPLSGLMLLFISGTLKSAGKSFWCMLVGVLLIFQQFWMINQIIEIFPPKNVCVYLNPIPRGYVTFETAISIVKIQTFIGAISMICGSLLLFGVDKIKEESKISKQEYKKEEDWGKEILKEGE